MDHESCNPSHAAASGRQAPPCCAARRFPEPRPTSGCWTGAAPADWVHTDPWRVLRIQAEFVEGFGLLAELGMAVSVFGSARAVPGTRDYELAERICERAGRASATR